MAPIKKSALILTYSCTGNTEKLADEAASALEADGWSVEKLSLREASEGLEKNFDFLVAGVPVHYWTVPPAASLLIDKMPSLEGVPAFAFCAFGGCVHHNAAEKLAAELSAKGARITGGAVVLTPHSCKVSEGKTLGEVDARFGMNEPSPSSIDQFRKAVVSSAVQASDPGLNLSSEKIRFSNAGVLARMMNVFVPLEKKMASMPGIRFNSENCIGCGKCMDVCIEGNFISDGNGKVKMEKSVCHKCYACASGCPSDAITSNWQAMEKMTRAMNRLAGRSQPIICCR